MTFKENELTGNTPDSIGSTGSTGSASSDASETPRQLTIEYCVV
ncbi:MAG: hypothetical protein ABI639_04100 [Thermoanaerobaculia bacterium]